MVEICVDNRSGREIDDTIINKMETCIRHCISIEKFSHNCEVSISFVDNDEIHQLNKQYRDKDSSTDVLSFPMYETFDHIPEDIDMMLGDIILSIPKCLEQAEEYGHSFERELCYLVTHGMFHLFGYDHMKIDDKKLMREKEKEVMSQYHE